MEAKNPAPRASSAPIGERCLSVVVPALNEATGIADSVQRVLAQPPALLLAGVARLEVIVVDDGSSDQTAAMVRGLKAGADGGECSGGSTWAIAAIGQRWKRAWRRPAAT